MSLEDGPQAHPPDPGERLSGPNHAGEATLSNEFARVTIHIDHDGNGQRLGVRSLRTGRQVFLDPLQLEALTWLTDDAYRMLLKEPFGPS